jgi:hypothetical protein
VAFKFLNVLVLNIAEKLLAGRSTPINQINHINSKAYLTLIMILCPLTHGHFESNHIGGIMVSVLASCVVGRG